MFDNSDPRKALTSMSKERSFSGPFCGPEVGNFSQEPPQQTGDGSVMSGRVMSVNLKMW